MIQLIRIIGFATVTLLLLPVATPVQAIDRSQCIQYGGSSLCWMPVIGRWKYDVCEEGAATLAWLPAKCQAQGGTGDGVTCAGAPPPEAWAAMSAIRCSQRR